MLPSEEYVQRLSSRRLRIAHFEKIHIWLGNVRLILALMFVVAAWASFGRHYFSAWWLALFVVAFTGVASRHSRILRERELAERAAAFYERGLARIEDRWAGSGETGEHYDDPHHVYASDLDLFGNASLFQLLSIARTRMGEDTLAHWLLAAARVEQILERQAAVRELSDQIDLREDLAVLGEDIGVGVHPEAPVPEYHSDTARKRLGRRGAAALPAAAPEPTGVTQSVPRSSEAWCSRPFSTSSSSRSST